MPNKLLEGFLDAAKAASLKKVPRPVAVLFSATGPRVKSSGIHLAHTCIKRAYFAIYISFY